MGLAKITVGANAKQNSSLSHYNKVKPLGSTEDPLSFDISTQLAVGLKTIAFNYLLMNCNIVQLKISLLFYIITV